VEVLSTGNGGESQGTCNEHVWLRVEARGGGKKKHRIRLGEGIWVSAELGRKRTFAQWCAGAKGKIYGLGEGDRKEIGGWT